MKFYNEQEFKYNEVGQILVNYNKLEKAVDELVLKT